jgi:hypothetical protein
MYIVPILTYDRAGTDLKHIWVFLERNGTHLIELDATPETAVKAATEFLEANEMPVIRGPVVVGDIVFAGIDSKSKEISSFYFWREVSPGTIPSKELWRPFLWFSNQNQSDPLGVNRLLDNISLSGANHNAFSVVSSYLKTCY